MASMMMKTLRGIPFPIFGTAATAAAITTRKVANAPKYAPWALPAAVGGLWFIWPAVDEEWKQSIGMGSPPPAAPEPAAKEEKVELSAEAQEKVEKAFIPEQVKELSADEKAVVSAVAKGDFTLLEKEWDAFQDKAAVPGDGDDDEDDDDDDDDDDEDEDEDEDDDDE